jgi:formate-nitrite transporter family protein
VMNILGGVLIAVIASSHHVLPHGSGEGFTKLADHIATRSTLPSFLSAVLAGALITVMTWFVEGAAETLGVRIAMAWIVGAVIALGAFNHVVVVTIELVFGMRYGADIQVSQLLANLGVAVAGNLVGGLGLVTFVRTVQAAEGSRGSD